MSEKKQNKEITDKKNISELWDKYRIPMARMYWIFLAIILLYDRLGTTPILTLARNGFGEILPGLPEDLTDLLFNSFCNLRYMILLPALYTVFFEIKDWKHKGISIILLAVGAFYAFYWRQQNDTLVFEVLLLMVASYGKDLKKIVYLGIGLTSGVVLITIIMARLGYLPDNTYISDGFTGHSFGFLRNTDVAAHLCFAAMLYIFLRNGVIGIGGYLIIIGTCLFNVLLLGGTNSLFCSGLCIFACVIKACRERFEWHFPKGMHRMVAILLMLSFVFFAAGYMILNFTYSEEPTVFYHSFKPFTMLGERLRVSANVTRVLPFSWFGKYFLQSESGLSFSTFLDCSYVRIYVMYGVAAFMLILLLFTGCQYRLLRKGMIFRMFILSVVAMDAVLEHRLPDPAYDLFLLLPFVRLGEEYGKTV